MKTLSPETKTTLASSLVIAVIFLLSWGVSHACTAFYQSEYVEGMSKICLYSHLNSPYAITIQSVKLCPLTVEVPH
jgi:hypothetical protein